VLAVPLSAPPLDAPLASPLDPPLVAPLAVLLSPEAAPLPSAPLEGVVTTTTVTPPEAPSCPPCACTPHESAAAAQKATRAEGGARFGRGDAVLIHWRSTPKSR
jgi:hypothetical protein